MSRTSHTAEFLEIGVTMPQAKVLYLVAAEGAAPDVGPRRPAAA